MIIGGVGSSRGGEGRRGTVWVMAESPGALQRVWRAAGWQGDFGGKAQMNGVGYRGEP